MRIIDNAIALRILWLLITPFEKTQAYKLGLISAEGEFLRKSKTAAEINSSSMLHRLVWRIKKFINMVPGGSTKIGSMVAAYALVRECIEQDQYLPTLGQLDESYVEREDLLVEGDVLELITDFMEALDEDAPANAVGSGTATSVDAPKIGKRKKAVFGVSDNTFNKFKSGKAKFRRWGAYLNLDDDVDREVYHYAKKNPRGVLVLQDQRGNSKGIRYSKHGGGNWHNIKRKPKQVVESFIQQDEIEIDIIDLC
jgi:hypothetical protein